MEEELLVNTDDLNSIRFSKPKKCQGTLMVSKIKKSSEPYLIQFPKMAVLQFNETVPGNPYSIQFEFVNQSGYTKKMISFLSKFDTFVKERIFQHSEEWFGKTIPLENLNDMYQPNTTLKFTIDKKTETTFDISELVKGSLVECICQMKYLIFTKESCFIHWEICTARLHKKVERVRKFGFIEDPADESDSEEIVTFF
jgi:hypothetical protein